VKIKHSKENIKRFPVECTPQLDFTIGEIVIFCRSNDLAWDGESKRIIAVGDGKEKSAFSNVQRDVMSFIPQPTDSAMPL